MELLIIAGVWVAIALAALVGGVDSRPRFDDEPHRSI